MASIEHERAQNLWASFDRKFPQVAKATAMEGNPGVGVEDIGGWPPPRTRCSPTPARDPPRGLLALGHGADERVVEVTPVFPDDIVAAVDIHVKAAEARAGRTLFESVDWTKVVSHYQGPSTGEWIRVMHAVLRRKARCEGVGEVTGPATTDDLIAEVDRLRQAQGQLPRAGGGIYL